MHTEIVQGHWLICGCYGRLSWDHVPPQGSIKITKIEQMLLTEVMGVDPVPVKGVTSPNGSKFKTICKSCNSNCLGANDQEVARVYNVLNKLVARYFVYANSPLSYVALPFDAVRFFREMIGHVLSATTVDECIREPVETSYFTPLQNFVMGDDAAIDGTHDLYSCFYPHRHYLSAKMFGCWNHGALCATSVLLFFPLAFSMTEKWKGIYFFGATKVELTDDRLFVNLSSGHFPYSGFPFIGLSGNQMISMASAQAIVSYLIKG